MGGRFGGLEGARERMEGLENGWWSSKFQASTLLVHNKCSLKEGVGMWRELV